MSKKTLLIILISVIVFSIFTIIFSPTKSLAQNNKKSFMAKIDTTLSILKEKILNDSSKQVKKNQKISPNNQEANSSTIPPVASTPVPLADSLKLNTNQEGLQIIALYEGPYIEAVAKSIDPSLNGSNFEHWNDVYFPVRSIFNSISERYKKLPPEKWPIIVMPMANYQAINSLIANEYPEPNGLNLVMPYINLSNPFPNTYNSTGNYKVALVGGGYTINDWTRGNKLDFIDSVEVQYVNPDPQLNYDITSISTTGNYTKIYNSTLAQHVRMGWLVWLNLQGSAGNVYQRYSISEPPSADYITVSSPINIGTFISGTAHVNYLSGTTAVVATKLKQIMNSTNCTFPQAVDFARATASNQGVRNNEVGYGKINVEAAIRYGKKYLTSNPNPSPNTIK
jgi:hypothetical protein